MTESNVGVNLDLDPTKDLPEGIQRKEDKKSLKPYVKYSYSNGSSFNISKLSYNGQEFAPLIEPDVNVKKVTTYFKNIRESILIIQVDTDTRFHYYMNTDISKPISSETSFEKFIANGKELTKNYILKPLEDLEINNRVEYYDLDKELRNNLWRSRDVCFHLSEELIRPGYISDVTGIKITVKQSKKFGFTEIQHAPSIDPFYIKGFKNTNDASIKVEGGFPNEFLEGFKVYYRENDDKYNDPLLAILAISKSAYRSYIPGQYLLSKTDDSTKWEILRIGGNGLDEQNDIQKILENIHQNKKLKVESLLDDLQKKLIDITGGLTINLDDAREEYGTYSSEEKDIPYKRIISRGYTSIAHAHTFSSFTIKEVKVTSDVSVSGVTLPTSGSRLSKLRAFYNGSTIKDPLLIYILENGGSSMWIYRYSGDKNWETLTGSNSPKNDVDFRYIQRLLEQHSIPNVTINFDKCATYSPEGNTLQFNVVKKGTSDPKYYGFAHTAQSARSFRVKNVYHGTTTLAGITSETPLKSITAYYLGDGHALGKLLMAELEVNSGSNFIYYRRVNGNDPTNWTTFGQTKKLEGYELVATLDKLVVAYFPPPPDPIPPIPPATTDNTSTGGVETGRHSKSTRYYQVAGAAIVGTIIGISILCFVIWKFTPVSRMYIVNRDPLL